MFYLFMQNGNLLKIKKTTMSQTVIIIITSVLALIFISFLIWKNQKDKKLLNPESENSVEETLADQERRRDSL